MKTSCDCRIIVFLFREIDVAESNCDVRILIGSLEIAVCGREQYKCQQNSQEQRSRRRAAFKLQTCNAFAIATLKFKISS